MSRPKSALKTLGYYLDYLYKAASEHHILLLASGLSFSIFTCIIPLVLVLFAILGIMLNQPRIEQEIGLYIDRFIPYPEESAFVKDLIIQRAEDFKVFKNLAGMLGILGMVFMSSGLFGTMRTILNRIYRIKSTRPVWSGKLKDIGLLFLVILYFLISITILPTSKALLEYAKKIGPSFFQIGAVTNLMLSFFSFLVALLLFLVIYWLIPQKSLPKKTVLMSAATAAVLWQIANQLFGIYISRFINFQNVYGAYSLIVVVAIWIYYTSVVFIIGATIAQAHKEKHIENAK